MATVLYERVKGRGDVIELLIALVVFIAPALMKHAESTGKESQWSLRHVFFRKFMRDDKWRLMVVLISLVIFEVLVVAPYQVYKRIKSENDKMQGTEIVRHS
jgi:hypothetical protein